MRTETSPLRGSVINQGTPNSSRSEEQLRARNHLDSRIGSLQQTASSTAMIPHRAPMQQSVSLQQRAYELSQKDSLTIDEAKELAALVRRAYQRSDHLQKFYSQNRDSVPPSPFMLPPDHYEDRLLAEHRRNPQSNRWPNRNQAPIAPPPEGPRSEESSATQPSKKSTEIRRLGVEPYQTNRPHNPHWGDTF